MHPHADRCIKGVSIVYHSHPLYSVLNPGENILWEGRPVRKTPSVRGPMLRQYIVYSLIYATIPVLLWLIGVMPFLDACIFFAGFELMCTSIFLYYYLMMRSRLRNDLYLVTDRRVLILVPARQRQGHVCLASRKLAEVSVVQVTVEYDDVVSLCLDPQNSNYLRSNVFCLHYLSNGEAVADLIRSRIGIPQED